MGLDIYIYIVKKLQVFYMCYEGLTYTYIFISFLVLDPLFFTMLQWLCAGGDIAQHLQR